MYAMKNPLQLQILKNNVWMRSVRAELIILSISSSPLSLTNRYQFSSTLSLLKAVSTVRYTLICWLHFSFQYKSYIHLIKTYLNLYIIFLKQYQLRSLDGKFCIILWHPWSQQVRKRSSCMLSIRVKSLMLIQFSFRQ